MIHATQPPDQIHRLAAAWKPTGDKLQAVGFFALQQVKERFKTQGASSGTPWPAPKRVKQWGADDGRSLLTGQTAHLRDSFQYMVQGNLIILFTDSPHARTHQFGATIKAKTAKARAGGKPGGSAGGQLGPSRKGSTQGAKQSAAKAAVKSGGKSGANRKGQKG